MVESLAYKFLASYFLLSTGQSRNVVEAKTHGVVSK